jgi:DNA polymerase
MDDRLKEEIAAWLEFYRELGIEDFYRRELGASSKLEAGNSEGETRNSPRPDGVSGKLETCPTPELPQPGTGVLPVGTPAGKLGSSPSLESRLPELDVQRSSFSLPHSERDPTPQSQIPNPAWAARIQNPKSKMQNLSLFEAPPAVLERETLKQVREDLGDCQRCKLAQGRKHIVFGQGNPHAELVFIGEGPGADEDEQGLPFVGRAGQLLNRMLQWVGIRREDVYICNVVKCRPPANRPPEKDEVDACSPFLFRQLEAIQPRLICCLGAPAVRTVLGLKEGMLKIRGHFYDYGNAKAMATVHPAYVLRNPAEEKILREDFQKIRDFLKGEAGKRGSGDKRC